MKIIGFVFNKMSGDRKKPITGKLEIKNNITLDNVREEKVNLTDKPALNIDFSFGVDYSPDVAEVKITGSVLLLDDNNESKQILKEWKDSKAFKHDSRTAIVNFIMQECTLKALQIEKDLSLPTHLPFPKFKKDIKPNPATYTG